jgi:chromosome segregation ATPase
LGCSLTGCAVSDNPREGGLIGGLYGIFSGTYDKRVQDRQHNLDSLKGLEQSGRVEQQGLLSDKAREQNELKKLQQQGKQLERELEKLNRQIVQQQARLSSAQQQAFQQRAQTLQAEVKNLQGKMQEDDASTAVKDYKQQAQRLQNEIKALKAELYQPQ